MLRDKIIKIYIIETKRTNNIGIESKHLQPFIFKY